MIRINLLPYRQMRQQQHRRRLQQLLTAAFSVGVILVLIGIVLQHIQNESQLHRRQLLQIGHQKLDEKIAQQVQLQKQLAQLSLKLAKLDHLHQQRNEAVKLLNELALCVPNTVVLTAIKQDQNHLSLHGNAASHQDIVRMLGKFNETKMLAGAQLRHTAQLGERQSFIITVAKLAEPATP